jgi:hypothetical protein
MAQNKKMAKNVRAKIHPAPKPIQSTKKTPKEPDWQIFKNEAVKAMAMNSAMLSRSMLAGRLGKQFGGDRDLYKSFGYIYNPQYLDYRALFERMGLAARCVEILPDDTWRKPAILIDGDERSDAEPNSAFLKAWNELADRLSVWQMFRQVDVLCGLGRYAILLMGAPGELDKPADNGGIAYLSAFDESQATIQEWHTDEKDPKYGLPKTYNINFNMYDQEMPVQRSAYINDSRVLHVIENPLGSRVYGRPRLQTILNRLFDLEKVTGGAAEAVWLTLFKGLIITSRENSEMPEPGSDEETALKQMMTDFVNRIQRYAMLDNAEVKDLGVDEIKVRDIYDVLTDDLLGSIGVPKRIFFGSERGELASTQDLRHYSGKIVSRQTNFAEPTILRPFINWCILHDVLPPPSNGKFKVWWPELFELTREEKAKIAKDVGDGAFRATNGAPEQAITPDEWRSLLDLPPIGEDANQTMPGTEIVPTPTGTVGNRPGKDETGATIEAKPAIQPA